MLLTIILAMNAYGFSLEPVDRPVTLNLQQILQQAELLHELSVKKPHNIGWILVHKRCCLLWQHALSSPSTLRESHPLLEFHPSRSMLVWSMRAIERLALQLQTHG